MAFVTLAVSGRHVRVCDPAWPDPLDGSFSMARGGRWNEPGSFPVVYLCSGWARARAVVSDQFARLPYGPEDIEEGEAPQLALIDVEEGSYVDAVSDDGLAACGLPEGYPDDGTGATVPWTDCEPIGRQAFEEGLDGVHCRSAAPAATLADLELAHIPRTGRGDALNLQDRLGFADWYWPGTPAAAWPSG